MLVGADINWKLVNDIRKDDNSGMIAINSSFGWIVAQSKKKNVNIVSSHVLKIKSK